MRKQNCKGEEHNDLPRDHFWGRSSISSDHHSNSTQLHWVKTRNTSNHRHRRYGKSFRPTVQQHLSQQEIYRIGLSVHAPSSTDNDMLEVSNVVQQIMTELSEAESEKDKIIVITKMVSNLI
jgi:hypothetical protein